MDKTPERIALLKTAVGKTEAEARQIIRLDDGNVYRDEIDAVMLKLFSTNHAFNEGVLDRVRGRFNKWRYSPTIEYSGYINYLTGADAAELAIILHGREAVNKEVFLLPQNAS